MKLRILLAFACVLTACGSASAAPINLVTNGSFEQGALGIGSFQGWQATLADASTFVDSNGQTGMQYGQASDGKWAAYFGSSSASGGSSIMQTLLTSIGQIYTLSFDLANDNGGLQASNSFFASIGGAPVFTTTNLGNQNYAHQQVVFKATGTATTLSFTGYNDQSYTELDNVAVVSAVPEPSSLVLIATGLLGCAVLAGVAKSR